MLGYIYLTKNLKTGKFYIGQHKADKFDKSYYGSGVLIKKAIKRYGKQSFIVKMLCRCETQEELNRRETYYIQLYDAKNKGYNLADGGVADGVAYFSPETKKEISKKVSNKLKGRHLTMEQREHLRQVNLGKHHTEATRKKMKASHADPAYRENQRQKHLGKKASEETLEKQSKALKGHKVSEETKRKISQSLMGHTVSQESIEKMRSKLKGRKIPREIVEKVAESNRRTWRKKLGKE